MTDSTCILPKLVDNITTDNGVDLTLFLSKDIDYFTGHFPNAPILAGVVQLDWAVKFSHQYLELVSDNVEQVEVLKFQVILVPEQHVVLSLVKVSEKKFTFKYHSERGVHASGRIILSN